MIFGMKYGLEILDKNYFNMGKKSVLFCSLHCIGATRTGVNNMFTDNT